jgi:hypothetical protein
MFKHFVRPHSRGRRRFALIRFSITIRGESRKSIRCAHNLAQSVALAGKLRLTSQTI